MMANGGADFPRFPGKVPTFFTKMALLYPASAYNATLWQGVNWFSDVVIDGCSHSFEYNRRQRIKRHFKLVPLITSTKFSRLYLVTDWCFSAGMEVRAFLIVLVVCRI